MVVAPGVEGVAIEAADDVSWFDLQAKPSMYPPGLESGPNSRVEGNDGGKAIESEGVGSEETEADS